MLQKACTILLALDLELWLTEQIEAVRTEWEGRKSGVEGSDQAKERAG